MFMRFISLVTLSTVWVLIAHTGANAASVATEFANPQPVVIKGYSGPEEDAYITPDNKYLFFDSHNDAGLPVNLYWATRIDYKTFTFGGQIRGTNYPGAMSLRGNYDISQKFYFFSLEFVMAGLPSIASGQFSNGAVTNPVPIEGITLPAPEPGTLRFMLDAEITSDGNTLYFTDWQCTAGGQPLSGQIKAAAKNSDGTFTVLPNSAELLLNVNNTGRLLYGSVPSADNLSLYFTIATPSVPSLEIYVATRTSTSDPFGFPQPVAAADAPFPPNPGVFVETGSISPDGNYLYFHTLLSPTSSQIYVLSRIAQ